MYLYRLQIKGDSQKTNYSTVVGNTKAAVAKAVVLGDKQISRLTDSL
jgi:hypothetical protein